MKIEFACPRCEQPGQVRWEPGQPEIRCPHCQGGLSVPDDAWETDPTTGRSYLARCLVCPSHDLFVRKDFPQRLGVAIVVAGFAISCVTWYYWMVYATFAVLFATAAIDVVLYLWFGEVLACYSCGAHYREVEGMDQHQGFDLAIHERYRQQAARMNEMARTLRTTAPGGSTAPALASGSLASGEVADATARIESTTAGRL